MIALVNDKRFAVADLCRRLGVRRLCLFGSGADGRFSAERSDLDFLVDFDDLPPADYSDRYFELADALERLFGRRVDLVTGRSIRNPYFRQTVEAGREILYER
ncbi:MAG: nucleotidyltransferase domain-containing protein [Planctomycetota bacterium]